MGLVWVFLLIFCRLGKFFRWVFSRFVVKEYRVEVVWRIIFLDIVEYVGYFFGVEFIVWGYGVVNVCLEVKF